MIRKICILVGDSRPIGMLRTESLIMWRIDFYVVCHYKNDSPEVHLRLRFG